jgi:hypothetical protein
LPGACAVGAALAYWRLDVFSQLRGLPLLLAGLLGWRAVRWRRAGGDRRAALPPLLVLAFALGCVARMPLATGAFHYGFYLLPVPLVAFTLFWFVDLPAWLPGRPVRLAAGAGAGVVLALVVAHHRSSRFFYDRHNTVVSTPRGRMSLLDDVMGYPTGRAYADTVRLLQAQPAGTRVLVIPEGVGLAFLAGLDTVCGLHTLLPPELDGGFEDRVLACLEAAPPALVVRVGLDVSEYGSRGFGEDYAQRIARWILAGYEPAAEFGPGGYVLVLRRRGGGGPGG